MRNDGGPTTGHKQRTTGNIVIVSGPSGAGKSTICGALAERIDNVFLSVSLTTRPRSPGEVNGKDYIFVERQQFEKKIAKGHLLEYAEVFGNLYGTPRDAVDRAVREGRTVILEIDVQGGKQAMRLYPDALSIFILPPGEEELARRIGGRGRESAEQAAARLSQCRKEIDEGRRFYRHEVVNDNLESAIDRIMQIVTRYTGEKNDRAAQEY